MPALTVLGNPSRRVITTYKGIPIEYEGGHYYVSSLRSPTGGRLIQPRLSSEAAARRYIGFALRRGARVVNRNPLDFGRPVQQSRRVWAVQYKHIQDGKNYEHEFGPHVCMELLSDGSIRIYSLTGKRLWADGF